MKKIVLCCGNTSIMLLINKIYPLFCLRLRNSTKQNKVKSSIYVNHGNDETGNPKPLISRGKHSRFGHIEPPKRSSLCLVRFRD